MDVVNLGIERRVVGSERGSHLVGCKRLPGLGLIPEAAYLEDLLQFDRVGLLEVGVVVVGDCGCLEETMPLTFNTLPAGVRHDNDWKSAVRASCYL